MAHALLNVNIKIILQNDRKDILALGAQDNGRMKGFNDLPGGRMDDNEIGIELLDIAKRELQEELGDITYTIDSRPFTAFTWKWDDGYQVAFIYYLAAYESGEITISDEHTNYKWVQLTQDNMNAYFTTHHKKALEKLL